MTHHTPFVCQIKIYGILRATEDDVNIIVPCLVIMDNNNMMNNLFYKFHFLFVC